jgi:hypothetical protein
MSIATSVTGILAPVVGQMVADTCVRATALSAGKTSDDLVRDDLPRLKENVRRLLSPIAPVVTIDALLGEIDRAV